MTTAAGQRITLGTVTCATIPVRCGLHTTWRPAIASYQFTATRATQ